MNSSRMPARAAGGVMNPASMLVGQTGPEAWPGDPADAKG
jgi:hypothetical protein